MAEFHFSVRPKVWIGNDSLLRLPLLATEYAGNGAARALPLACDAVAAGGDRTVV